MSQVMNAVIAIGAGVALGVLAFVPYVMITIRRYGRFGIRRALAAFAFLVYALAIWSYTLLPLPLPSELRCAGVNLNPFAFVGDIAGAISRGHPLTDFALLQLVLNVALFVPLGFFIRLLWHRGILVSLGVGLGISLLIETTQVTGVWGLYDCAYRVFDVDDLLTNTLGAVLGSVFSLALPRAWRLGRADAAVAAMPQPVTRGRRLLAMLVDALGTALLSGVSSAGVALLVFVIAGRDALIDNELAISNGVAVGVLLLTAAITLATGYTLGDAAVRLQYRGGNLPTVLARLLRFVGGIGGYQLLALLVGSDSLWLGGFALACAVAMLATRDGRGLPGLLSGQRLDDARSTGETASVDQSSQR